MDSGREIFDGEVRRRPIVASVHRLVADDHAEAHRGEICAALGGGGGAHQGEHGAVGHVPISDGAGQVEGAGALSRQSATLASLGVGRGQNGGPGLKAEGPVVRGVLGHLGVSEDVHADDLSVEGQSGDGPSEGGSVVAAEADHTLLEGLLIIADGGPLLDGPGHIRHLVVWGGESTEQERPGRVEPHRGASLASLPEL
ncbi:hypothetical protein CMI47_11765 [Candidatus Pacearchaeota archaeon]|nr:hypothetical protein [Candidatus Pacearchaeota archaeon]